MNKFLFFIILIINNLLFSQNNRVIILFFIDDEKIKLNENEFKDQIEKKTKYDILNEEKMSQLEQFQKIQRPNSSIFTGEEEYGKKMDISILVSLKLFYSYKKII